jgi:LysM repeat protein
MPLEKLKITNTDSNAEFEVLFNPSEYTFESSSKWEEQKGNRRPPELQYTGGERKKLSMDLFFDTYETLKDVRQFTAQFAQLLVVTTDNGNNGKRPPVVQLSWGPANPDSGFPFVCVLASLKQNFVLFASDGTPVRAKLSVSFTEFALPVQDEQKAPRRGSSPAQTYTVRAHDTLNGITSAVWQDPTNWRLIAEQNDIDNPRILTPGTTLVIPAVQ